VDDLTALRTGQKTAISKTVLVSGTTAPMALLLAVHNVLYGVEVRLRDERLVNDLDTYHIVGSTHDLSAVSLSPIFAGVFSGGRRVTFLVYDTPPSPDRVS
jgi:hypothetical protein